MLVGRNDVGKSNIGDFFTFLRDAFISFPHALTTRGGKMQEVLHRKSEGVFAG
jgi:predicted ATPase